MKVIFTSKRSISMLIFLILGTIFFILGYKLIEPVLYFIGTLVCLAGLLKLTLLNKNNTPKADFILDLIEGIVSICVGVVTIQFWNYNLVIFITGFVYLVIPVIRLFMAKNLINQLFVDSLKYLSIIVMISCINKEKLTGHVVGAIFYGIAIFIFVTLIIKIKRIKRSEYINEIQN